MFSSPSTLLLSYLVSTTALFAGTTLATPCVDQSCKIADVSGETGQAPAIVNAYRGHLKSQKPSGVKCIERWWLSGFNLNSPDKKKRDGLTTAEEARAARQALELETSLGGGDMATYVAESLKGLVCKPNILMFARGTLEPGEIGTFVGPKVAKDLEALQPGQWQVVPLHYKADWAGDYCAGIPGGKVAANVLDQLVQLCPNSKIVVSGYSQGAMAVRIGVAFGTQKVRENVVGVLTFGDPFNGAIIAGYNSNNIATYCRPNDGVCGGALRVGPAHLSYGSSTEAGAQWIANKVATSSIGPSNLGPGQIFNVQAAGGAAAVAQQLGINPASAY